MLIVIQARVRRGDLVNGSLVAVDFEQKLSRVDLQGRRGEVDVGKRGERCRRPLSEWETFEFSRTDVTMYDFHDPIWCIFEERIYRSVVLSKFGTHSKSFGDYLTQRANIDHYRPDQFCYQGFDGTLSVAMSFDRQLLL
jgi:hypothetical protein